MHVLNWMHRLATNHAQFTWTFTFAHSVLRRASMHYKIVHTHTWMHAVLNFDFVFKQLCAAIWTTYLKILSCRHYFNMESYVSKIAQLKKNNRWGYEFAIELRMHTIQIYIMIQANFPRILQQKFTMKQNKTYGIATNILC